METRTAGLLVGALAVCCVGLALSVVYPFALSEPHAANPPDERFTVGEADSYRATGRIVVDGEVTLAFEGVVTADGRRYQSVTEPGVRSEAFQPSPDAPVYERIELDHADAERLRDRIAADDDRRLVRDGRNGGRTVLVVEKNTTALANAIPGTAAVVVRSLHVAGYGTKAGDSADVTVHEPRNGWYDGREPYRITAASGAVRTDADTSAVESATVSWTVTAPAGTYAAYLLAGLTGEGSRTYEVSFEFDEGAGGLERPAWVDETRAG